MATPAVEPMEARLKRIKAADIMSRHAITTTEDATIAEIADMMMRFKISGIPVLSADKKIVGIITTTDLFRLMQNITTNMDRGAVLPDYYGLQVKAVMTTQVIAIVPETSLYDVMKIMNEKNIHTLPVIVVSNQEIVGVLGRRDVINSCYTISPTA